jgi:hypothetical protein
MSGGLRSRGFLTRARDTGDVRLRIARLRILCAEASLPVNIFDAPGAEQRITLLLRSRRAGAFPLGERSLGIGTSSYRKGPFHASPLPGGTILEWLSVRAVEITPRLR